MSLYYDAAALLDSRDVANASLKSRVFGNKTLKSPPVAVYALVSEATKWSNVLKEVIERSDLVKLERKLTPSLALLLVHDLLLAKKGIATRKDHVLAQSVVRHRARLQAELTKCRIRRGFANLDDLRTHVNDAALGISTHDGKDVLGTSKPPFHPRWIRINAVRSNKAEVLSNTFSDYESVETLQKLPGNRHGYYIDENIPDLVAVHPSQVPKLVKSQAYLRGNIIFQDKASCFPAYLLDPQPEDKHVFDACAAPGNKTSHLAAILSGKCKSQDSVKSNGTTPKDEGVVKITACERSPARAVTLSKMLKLAGAEGRVKVLAGRDFLNLKPFAQDYIDVGALLLDPSCSGSGIVGRDEQAENEPVLHLPTAFDANSDKPHTMKNGKKRKRTVHTTQAAPPIAATAEVDAVPEEQDVLHEEDSAVLAKRLKSLSGFQLKIILHAFRFPAAEKVTYSTCSVHFEENEAVVIAALLSPIARERGWTILKRQHQVPGLRKWDKRGKEARVAALLAKRREAADGAETMLDAESIADGCIRCDKGTSEGTMGFFVAAFVRGAARHSMEEAGTGDHDGDHTIDTQDDTDGDEEWQGFSD